MWYLLDAHPFVVMWFTHDLRFWHLWVNLSPNSNQCLCLCQWSFAKLLFPFTGQSRKQLLCGSCLQRFDTPWSLLKHAQNTHALQIYLQNNAALFSQVQTAPKHFTCVGDRSDFKVHQTSWRDVISQFSCNFFFFSRQKCCVDTPWRMCPIGENPKTVVRYFFTAFRHQRTVIGGNAAGKIDSSAS